MAAPASSKIGTKYGVKGDLWAAGHHTGVDILTPSGTTLKAAANGKVIHAGRGGWGSAYGIHVIVQSVVGGRIYRWMTAHMSSVSVKVGQTVKLGDKLGKSGATGHVTGPHCHFEARVYPYKYGDDVNPAVVLNVTAAKPKPKTTLRITTYNIPDKAKLPNEDARIKRAAGILKGDKPDVIIINEGVGRKAPGVPSDFMAKLWKAIGGEPEWACVVPTTDANENYILFRRAAAGHVAQYPDRILTGKSGRHITRDVLKVKATGQVVAIGATHLIDGKANGADRTKQGAQAAVALAEVSQDRGDCPVIIAGDMNRSDDLPGMLAIGLANARGKAKQKTNVSWATFTTEKAKTPSTNLAHVYDHVYVPDDWSVANWINRLDTDADGKFRQPRPSDHTPVVVVCTSP